MFSNWHIRPYSMWLLKPGWSMLEKKLEQCMFVMIVLVIVDINLQKEEKNASDKECPTTCELLRIEEERIGDRPQRNHCSERTSRDYLLLWRSDLRPLLLLQPDGSSLNQRLRAMLLPLRSRQNGPPSFQGHSLLKRKMTKPTQQCWFKTRHSKDELFDTYHL